MSGFGAESGWRHPGLGSDVTEVRSLHRTLLPDTVGPDHQKPTSLQGIANKARVHDEDTALHRGCEYNRGTGCGKTARPGLHGGCRVTGIPTVESPTRTIPRKPGNSSP